MTSFALSYHGVTVGILTHTDLWIYASTYPVPGPDFDHRESVQGVTIVTRDLPDWAEAIGLLPDFESAAIRRVMEEEGIEDDLGVLLRFKQDSQSPWRLRLIL